MSSDLIAALDDALGPVGSSQGVGEDVILRNPVGAPANQRFASVTVRAKVTAVSEAQISAGISQTDLNVIFSPTQINQAQWPGGQPVQVGQFTQDPRIPVAGKTQMIVRGRIRVFAEINVQRPGNEIVRFDGRVTG